MNSSRMVRYAAAAALGIAGTLLYAGTAEANTVTMTDARAEAIRAKMGKTVWGYAYYSHTQSPLAKSSDMPSTADKVSGSPYTGYSGTTGSWTIQMKQYKSENLLGQSNSKYSTSLVPIVTWNTSTNALAIGASATSTYSLSIPLGTSGFSATFSASIYATGTVSATGACYAKAGSKIEGGLAVGSAFILQASGGVGFDNYMRWDYSSTNVNTLKVGQKVYAYVKVSSLNGIITWWRQEWNLAEHSHTMTLPYLMAG